MKETNRKGDETMKIELTEMGAPGSGDDFIVKVIDNSNPDWERGLSSLEIEVAWLVNDTFDCVTMGSMIGNPIKAWGKK